MFKLQLYGNDLEKSLNLENFDQIQLKNLLGEPRELKLFCSSNLGRDFANIVTRDDKKVFLQLETSQNLFEKKDSSFSHLFAVGSSGQGTNEKTAIWLDSTFFGQDYKYTLVDYNSQFYILNPNYTGVGVKIKIQQFENVQSTTDLYEKACSYISNFENNSKQQIDRLNDCKSEITYISTCYNKIKYSQRNFAINHIYSGSMQTFLNNLSVDVDFVLLSGDRFLSNYDTGAFDNFDMFEEVIKKRFGYSYVDLGFYNGKNVIEIADFTSLPVEYTATNFQTPHNFYKKMFEIKQLERKYPGVAIDFEPKQFVKEGTIVFLNYKSTGYPKNAEPITEIESGKRIYGGSDFINISEYLKYDS